MIAVIVWSCRDADRGVVGGDDALFAAAAAVPTAQLLNALTGQVELGPGRRDDMDEVHDRGRLRVHLGGRGLVAKPNPSTATTSTWSRNVVSWLASTWSVPPLTVLPTCRAAVLAGLIASRVKSMINVTKPSLPRRGGADGMPSGT